METSEIFSRVDKSNDGKISIEEFKNLFDEYDFSELGDLATNLINELRQIIISYNLNLQDIFKNFDKDKEGQYNYIKY